MTPSDKAPEVTADNEFVVCDPPIEFWALPYREKSERKLAFSFDGPVSPRYGAYILKSSYDALKSEVERVREETLNLRDDMRDDLREELTREREISAMLRERLNLIRSHDRLLGYPTGSEWMQIVKDIAVTLAKEKEMLSNARFGRAAKEAKRRGPSVGRSVGR